MSFLIQFIPVSNASHLAIGFLFFALTRRISYQNTILITVIFLILLCYYCGYNKVCAAFIGFLLGFAHNFYFQSHTEEIIFDKKSLELLNTTANWKISFQKEIKRNFYETKYQSGQLEFTIITKRTKKEIYLPTFLCDSKFIYAKEIPYTEDFFHFLQPYSYNYLQIKESKCKRISEEINPKKLIRKQIEKVLERAQITDYANDIAMGLFFGDANYLENEFKEKVREGGVLHLFAASGLHIGVFIGFIYFFSKRIWFFNFYTERIFPLLVAFSYLYILDFPVSLLRAYIFTSLLVLGSIFFRKIKSIDLILISSSFILLIDSESFLTLSFNLSYSAVCGILFLKNYLDKLIFLSKKNFFTENFTISIAASLGTYPILLIYFKTFSFGSIFLNLILVPLTSLLLPLLYICLCLQILFEFIISQVSIPSSNFILQINSVIDFFFVIESALEILWVYAELLLRSLAFLSENLSIKLGFFRSVENSFSFHIGIYFVLILFLSIGFLVLESGLFSKKNKKRKFFLYIFSFSYFLLIVSFFYFGFVLYPEEKSYNSNYQFVSASSDYYLVKEEEQIYLGGNCKYNAFKIQKLLREICLETTKEIYIEEESCLSLALNCKNKSNEANVYSSKTWLDWEEKYSTLHSDKNASKRKFKNLLIFYPHLDSLSQLQKFSRESNDNGKILLLFAYKLKDNAKDWNSNKNLLGINPNWNFITPDEL